MASEEAKEKLERLRSIRGAQRGIVTKNVNKANAIFGDEAAQAYISSEQLQQLEVISRLLGSKTEDSRGNRSTSSILVHPRRNYTGDRGIGEVCGEGYQLPEENTRCFSEDHWRATRK